MSLEQILFYVFSTIAVLAAGMVVTVRNPVHAAMFLVLTFFSSAALWMLLEAEFLAIALVLVYVGAVMVLFLFVVMMLDLNPKLLREGFARYLPFGIVVAVLIALIMGMAVGHSHFGLAEIAAPAPHAANYSNTQQLGELLYTSYVYPFEIAAVILLVAIVSAIALTLRRRPNTKHQSVGRQVATRRADRVRLVSMSVEERK